MGFPEDNRGMESASMVHYVTIEKLEELLDDLRQDCKKRNIDLSSCFISFVGSDQLHISLRPEKGSDLTGPAVGRIFLGEEKYFRIK